MKRIYFASAMAFMAVAVLSSCGGSKNEKAVEEAVKTKVKTEVSAEQTIDQVAEFTGTILPYAVNNIVPSMPVRIERIYVEVGARVSKGQLLAVMDKTQYNQTAVQLAALEIDYQRLKAVYDAGGASRQQIDNMESQLTVMRDAAANLNRNTQLRSPINGVVTARNYDSGDMFPGAGLPVLTVMQINPLKVKMDVPESYFMLVKNGTRVAVTVDILPEKEFDAKVSLIYPSINTANRTFAVEATIQNNDNSLRPGMFSRSEIRFGTKTGVLVSDLAIQKQQGTNEKFVFVAKEGKAERRVVNVGRTVGNKVDILSGVAAGEEIVTAGASKLVDGDVIEVQK